MKTATTASIKDFQKEVEEVRHDKLMEFSHEDGSKTKPEKLN